MSTDIFENFYDAMRVWFGVLDDTWEEHRPNAFAFSTATKIDFLNTVFVTGDAATQDVKDLFAKLRARGLPCSVTIPAGSDLAREAINELGLVVGEFPMPFMTLPLTGQVHAKPTPSLTIRQVDASESVEWCTVLANGFAMPYAIAEVFGDPRMMNHPEMPFYLGEVNGTPVACGQGVRVGSAMGVFCIATVPEARGNGFAAALTEQIGLDAYANGATTAFLQASPMGTFVYPTIGYSQIDEWHFYVAPPAVN